MFTISTLLTLLSSFLIAIFIFLKHRGPLLNKLWIFTSLSIGFWALGLFGVIISTDKHFAYIFQYILDIGAIFIPIFYIHFVTVLVGIHERKKIFLQIGYLFAIVLAFLSFTSWFKIDIQPIFHFPFWIVPGPIYFLFPLYFIILAILSLYILSKYYFQSSGIKKLQIKYVFIAGLLGYIGGITNFFPQLINIYPFGNFLIILYAVIIGYAIIKIRFFDIKIVVKKSLIFTLSIIIVFTLYLYLAIMVRDLFIDLLETKETIIDLILVFIVSLGFLPLRKSVEKWIDKIFFKKESPGEKGYMKRLREIMSPKADWTDFFTKVFKEINKKIKIEESAFLVFDSRQGLYIEKHPHPKNITLAEDDFLVSYLKDKRETIVYDEISHLITQLKNSKLARLKRVEKRIRKFGYKVAMPIMDGHKLIAIILLGSKKSQKLYTVQDIKYLEELSPQIAFALANIILYRHTMEGVVRRAQKKTK